MPKRKITLEDAYAVFEQHGLKVEVKATQSDQPRIPLSDFLEPVEQSLPVATPAGKTNVRITLYAAHTVGNGGQITVNANGDKSVTNNGIETYGPGVVTVPATIAQHLLHQDQLAQQADARMLESTMRNYIIVHKSTSHGAMNCGILVAQDNSFNMSDVLGKLGNNHMMQIG